MANLDPDLARHDEALGTSDDALRDQILDSARDDVPAAGSRDQLLAAFDLAPASVAPRAATRGLLGNRYIQIVGIALAIGAGTAAISFASGSVEKSSRAKIEEPPALPAAPASVPPLPARVEVVDEPPSPAPVAIDEREKAAPPRAKHTASPALSASSAKTAEDSKGSSLGREVARVTAARSALAGGDAARTLELLDSYDAEFPAGALSVEVSVLRIEALMRSGRADDARRLGDRFLAAHPRGAFARRVENTLESSAKANRDPAAPPSP